METIIYTDPSTHLTIPDVVFFQDTIWMTQTQMSKLYDTDASGISRHIAKIYWDGELDEMKTSTDESKLQKMQNTQNSFKKAKKYYNHPRYSGTCGEKVKKYMKNEYLRILKSMKDPIFKGILKSSNPTAYSI